MKPISPTKINLKDFINGFKTPKMGVSTGIKILDEAMLGFQPGKYYVLGGASGSGKSSLMGGMALAACTEVPVGMLSIEMGKDISDRLICTLADVNYTKACHAKLDKHESKTLESAVEKFNGLNNLYIEDGSVSMFYPHWREEKWKKGIDPAPNDSIEYQIESWVDAGVKVVFLDYLQMADLAERRERDDLKVKDMSRKLKLMCDEYKISIVTLVQLDKKVEDREDKKPTKNDLWGSSFIRNDADVILLTFRPEMYKSHTLDLFSNTVEDATIIIDKQRNSCTGEVPVKFCPYSFRYCDVEDEGMLL